MPKDLFMDGLDSPLGLGGAGGQKDLCSTEREKGSLYKGRLGVVSFLLWGLGSFLQLLWPGKGQVFCSRMRASS